VAKFVLTCKKYAFIIVQKSGFDAAQDALKAIIMVFDANQTHDPVL
jgi:hypothetical protein